ncbi:MAG: histidinol-phosphate transaminase [Candidatus Lokiarchaeota archaeon]|nr:histidinol-phosphate transaminase [Candidatus Lokiarchaeota archaeon]
MRLKNKYQKLLSCYLKDFEPYTGEISIPMLVEKRGISKNDLIKLDANENDFIDKEWLNEILRKAINEIDITRYPDPQAYELRKIIAKYQNTKIDNIIMGNGTDDLIDCIIRMFLDHKSDIIVIEPTFSMYKYSASMIGSSYTPVLLKPNFDLDIQKLENSIKPNTKLIFICSPNNPTANQFFVKEISNILDLTDKIVVIDEAYVDFARYSISKDTNLIDKYDNLVLLKSYSKSWGLAGLRAGYAIANPEIIEFLRSIRKVYNFNSVAQAMLLEMYKNYDDIQSKIEQIKKERQWLSNQISKFQDLLVYPSETNFILIKLINNRFKISQIMDKFLTKNILIRDRSNLPLLDNCFRITVSNRKTNLCVIETLKTILKEE